MLTLGVILYYTIILLYIYIYYYYILYIILLYIYIYYYYILYILYLILSFSFCSSSLPSPSLPIFCSPLLFLSFLLFPLILFLFPLLSLFHLSSPLLLLFPILIYLSIQSIRVGIWISLFMFDRVGCFDPACFIGVDG